LNYKDCRSCFACKLKGNKTGGVCAVRDDLREILEKVADSDSLIIGSPVYYGNLTAETLAFINRVLFPIWHYQIDLSTGKPESELKKPKKCGLIATMNATEDYINSGYAAPFESLSSQIALILGSCETLYSCDTYQFDDYSKYYAGM